MMPSRSGVTTGSDASYRLPSARTATSSTMARSPGRGRQWQREGLVGPHHPEQGGRVPRHLSNGIAAGAVGYERSRPGELLHIDVKKLGRIPAGGGWRALGRTARETTRNRTGKLGYDYVHSLVDDHSRLAYSEILPDEKGATCAAFFRRGAAYFADHGIDQIERVMTDNALGIPVVAARGHHRAGRPSEVHQTALPVAERQGRTTQPHPGHRVGLPPGVHQQRRARRRPCPVARALQHSTPPQRTGRAPSDQPPGINVMAGYT